jgi:hypothetical protein
VHDVVAEAGEFPGFIDLLDQLIKYVFVRLELCRGQLFDQSSELARYPFRHFRVHQVVARNAEQRRDLPLEQVIELRLSNHDFPDLRGDGRARHVRIGQDGHCSRNQSEIPLGQFLGRRALKSSTITNESRDLRQGFH